MTRVVAWTLGPRHDAATAGAVLADLAPAVVLLCDQPTGRGLRRLASRAGLDVAARAGRGRTGSAVLVRPDVRVRTTTSLVLPGSGTEREAAHAILSVDGRALSALAFRLGADPDGRVADAGAVAAFLDSVEHLDVAGGDLGEGVGGPATRPLVDGRVDAWAVAGTGRGDTYPTPDPLARHDVVVVDRGLRVAGASVATGSNVDAAAGHRPVVVDLEDLA